MSQTTVAKLEEDLKVAAKTKDQITLTVLRLLKTALKNYEIEVGHDATPQEILKVLQTEAKKRNDSIAQYKAANRVDLVAEEQAELDILQKYLPTQITGDELTRLIEEIIKQQNATGLKDMGQVMQELSKQTGGNFNGSTASEIVKAKLT